MEKHTKRHTNKKKHTHKNDRERVYVQFDGFSACVRRMNVVYRIKITMGRKERRKRPQREREREVGDRIVRKDEEKCGKKHTHTHTKHESKEGSSNDI